MLEMKPKKYRRCCGIDVHKKNATVCILPPIGQPEVEVRKRTFRTFTRDLKQLRTWLKNCKVTEIAMESTGQYWRPIWNILEDHFEKLILVNPQHIKGLAGQKTDPKDAEWIASLLETGKLKGSLVPQREIRELRDVTRERVNLVEDLNRAKNRIEQLCQAGNIKISSVATDLFGSSGRTMLKSLIEGRRDAGWMADYARGKLRGKRRELEAALEGTFTDSQRWLLSKELNHVEWLEIQVQVLDQEIERRVAPLEESMRRVMTIPGIDHKTAWTIVAEIGVDMNAFADARHLASWAGLCPGNRESGGKRMSGRTRKANRYVRRAMCQAAWAASHTKNTFLSAFYRRMLVRKGPQKAVMALAHHMITIVYNILRRGEEYVEMGGDFYDRQNKPKVVSRMVARLMKLGYQVTLTPTEMAELASAELPSETAAGSDADFDADLVSSELEPEAIETAGFNAEFDEDLVPTVLASEPSVTEVLESEFRADLSPADENVTQKRKRGRPCKCVARGIICKHKAGLPPNLLETHALEQGKFS
jgi:transposase